jgi:hypothetical protein
VISTWSMSKSYTCKKKILQVQSSPRSREGRINLARGGGRKNCLMNRDFLSMTHVFSKRGLCLVWSSSEASVSPEWWQKDCLIYHG